MAATRAARLEYAVDRNNSRASRTDYSASVHSRGKCFAWVDVLPISSERVGFKIVFRPVRPKSITSRILTRVQFYLKFQVFL